MRKKLVWWVTAILLSSSMNINECLSQQLSIFNTQVPAHAVASGTYSASHAITLGLKFWSSQSGTISGIRFYRGATSPLGYVARLYSADGSKLLGSVTMAKESAPVPGWQTALFPAPIPISPNTTYVAAYYAPSGQYAYTNSGLNNGLVSSPLTAPASSAVGGNGVFSFGLAFPLQTYQATNYFADVLFTPAPGQSPVLSLSVQPPNPSITSTAPSGTAVATIVATWSDGSPFTGTFGFAQPYSNDGGVFALVGNKLIINPSGPGVGGLAGTVQNATVVATQ